MSLSNEERTTLVSLVYYIKTGILPIEYGRLYSQLQTMREESDYNCVYEVDPDELSSRIEPAKELIDAIEILINSPTEQQRSEA